MSKKFIQNLSLFALALLLACAGSSGGGSGDGSPSAKDAQFSYSANVGQSSGVVTLEGFQDIAARIVEGRYAYRILRYRELGNRLTFETDWLNRPAFPEEQALGATEARTKIYGEAKFIRLTAGGDAKVSSVSFTGETMLAKVPGAWELQPVTDECKKYLRDVFGKFETELVSKMRSF